MKSFPVIWILIASISIASCCFCVGHPVCARVKNTNTCETFNCDCQLSLTLPNGDYEPVDMKYCRQKIGITNCLLKPAVPWICGTECRPRKSAKVCTYKISAQKDTCRFFRNPCEFKNYNCEKNPALYARADISRCAKLTNYNVDGECV